MFLNLWWLLNQFKKVYQKHVFLWPNDPIWIKNASFNAIMGQIRIILGQNVWPGTGLILTILYVKIDPYSGSKIDPEFWVKYVDSGVWVDLTRFASVAYWPGSGSRFNPFWVKFNKDVFRVYVLVGIDNTFNFQFKKRLLFHSRNKVLFC